MGPLSSNNATPASEGSSTDSFVPSPLKLILLKVMADLPYPQLWGLGPEDILRMASYVIRNFREDAEILLETLRVIEKYYEFPRLQEHSERFEELTLELIKYGPEKVRMEAIGIATIIGQKGYLENVNDDGRRTSSIFRSLECCMTEDESPLVRKEAGIALGSLCFSTHFDRLFQVCVSQLLKENRIEYECNDSKRPTSGILLQ